MVDVGCSISGSVNFNSKTYTTYMVDVDVVYLITGSSITPVPLHHPTTIINPVLYLNNG
jgi:hypothetical protein